MAIGSGFLFVVLPCLVLLVVGNAMISQSVELVKSRSAAALESRAEQVCSLLDPGWFFAARFASFTAGIDWQNLSRAKIQELYAGSDGPQLGFIPYVFKNGSLITPPELLDETAEKIAGLWPFFHKRSQKSSLQNKSEANALFGMSIPRLWNSSHNELFLEFSGHRGRGMLHYANPDRASSLDGILLIAWSVPEAEKLVKFLPAESLSGLTIRIESRGRLDGETSVSSGGGNDARLQQDCLTVRRTVGNRYVHFMQKFSELNHNSYKTFLHILVMLLAMVLATIMKDPVLRSRGRGLSIRHKLAALILYAVVLPLSGLGYFGWKFVVERRELLQQEAFIACQNSINELENGFNQEQFKILNFFRSFRNLPDMASNTSVLRPLFQDYEAKRKMNWIEVRDIHTNLLLTTQDSELLDKIGVVSKVFGRHGINSFLSHRIPARQSVIPSAQEIMLQEFLESPCGGWARIFEGPDELHIVSFAGFDMFWYWDVFPQSDVRPAFILCDQHIKWSVKDYLRENLNRRSTARHSALRRLAWMVEDSRLIESTDVAVNDDLLEFIGRIRRKNSLQSGLISWQNERWIIAGAPGKRLTGNILLSLYPLSQIDRQISLIVTDLAWGAILALLLAFVVGRLFSATIIDPLTSLMKGVNALRHRDTSSKIEIMQNDELGRLSASFNHTIETLEDVLFARKIQAQMIPDTAPEIRGFQTDLYYSPAADLGGDYCDIQPLGGDRWLLVIGDVTGHGVSSALVTAMAKSVVIQCIAKKGFVPGDIFACLNELLYSQFKRRKCMTFFAATLDADSGKICCMNAGQPLPMHFSGGIRQNFPALFHAPLGFSVRDQNFPAAEFMLGSDDCLIFYTDGFVETRDKSGTPLGSAGFEALCREFLHLPAAEMRAKILARISAISAGELEDDLTLIILKRSDSVQSSC